MLQKSNKRGVKLPTGDLRKWCNVRAFSAYFSSAFSTLKATAAPLLHELARNHELLQAEPGTAILTRGFVGFPLGVTARLQLLHFVLYEGDACNAV